MKKGLSHGGAKGLKQHNTIGRGGWRRATKVLDWRIEDSEACEMSQNELMEALRRQLSSFDDDYSRCMTVVMRIARNYEQRSRNQLIHHMMGSSGHLFDRNTVVYIGKAASLILITRPSPRPGSYVDFVPRIGGRNATGNIRR